MIFWYFLYGTGIIMMDEMISVQAAKLGYSVLGITTASSNYMLLDLEWSYHLNFYKFYHNSQIELNGKFIIQFHTTVHMSVQ